MPRSRWPGAEIMSLADDFPQITRRNEPLAPHTHLRIGGPAEFLVTPRSIDELRTEAGTVQTRARDELTFSEHQSDLDEPVILSVEFELDRESRDAVLKRMRRAWILRKAAEPFSFQAAVRLFRGPPGQSAAVFI